MRLRNVRLLVGALVIFFATACDAQSLVDKAHLDIQSVVTRDLEIGEESLKESFVFLSPYRRNGYCVLNAIKTVADTKEIYEKSWRTYLHMPQGDICPEDVEQYILVQGGVTNQVPILDIALEQFRAAVAFCKSSPTKFDSCRDFERQQEKRLKYVEGFNYAVTRFEKDFCLRYEFLQVTGQKESFQVCWLKDAIVHLEKQHLME